jgi:hypothetical protein
MNFNFKELTSKDLFFVKKNKKTRIFQDNMIVKFRPSTILLGSVSVVSIWLVYKFVDTHFLDN